MVANKSLEIPIAVKTRKKHAYHYSQHCACWWISAVRCYFGHMQPQRWSTWGRLITVHYPWEQGTWGQHGAHLGTTGPRWAPCWPHEPFYLGHLDKLLQYIYVSVCVSKCLRCDAVVNISLWAKTDTNTHARWIVPEIRFYLNNTCTFNNHLFCVKSSFPRNGDFSLSSIISWYYHLYNAVVIWKRKIAWQLSSTGTKNHGRQSSLVVAMETDVTLAMDNTGVIYLRMSDISCTIATRFIPDNGWMKKNKCHLFHYSDVT